MFGIYADLFDEVDQRAAVLPGLFAVAAEGAGGDDLGLVQVVQGHGEQVDSVVDESRLGFQEGLVDFSTHLNRSNNFKQVGV